MTEEDTVIFTSDETEDLAREFTPGLGWPCHLYRGDALRERVDQGQCPGPVGLAAWHSWPGSCGPRASFHGSSPTEPLPRDQGGYLGKPEMQNQLLDSPFTLSSCCRQKTVNTMSTACWEELRKGAERSGRKREATWLRQGTEQSRLPDWGVLACCSLDGRGWEATSSPSCAPIATGLRGHGPQDPTGRKRSWGCWVSWGWGWEEAGMHCGYCLTSGLK